MMVRLTGITKKGKERIKQHGPDQWKIVKIEDQVSFSDYKGPWLLIEKGKYTRWVHLKYDDHFIVEEEK